MAAWNARSGHRHRGRIGSVALVLACTLVLAACSSGGKSTTASTLAPPPTTAAPTKHGMTVNLVLTGDRHVTITGNKGACYLRSDGQPSTYVITGADYPVLGASGRIDVWGLTHLPKGRILAPNVKIYLDGAGLLSPNTGAGVAVAPNDMGVRFNTNLGGSLGGTAVGSLASPTNTLHAHLNGSIRCT